MYVAMTRARHSLTILASEARPSAFVTELRTDPAYALDAMGAAEVDSRRLAVGKNYVFIYFVGRKHPQRLAEQYMSVAGVTGAYPDGWIGDRPNVYPWYIPDGMSYLVRDAFDDCPAGCIENIFHYFKRVNGQTEYVGSYHLAAQPEPAWWAEAKVPFYVYLGGQDPRTFH